VAGDRPNDGPAKAGNTQTTRVTARVSEGPAHTRTVRSRRSRFGLGPTAAPALSRSARFRSTYTSPSVQPTGGRKMGGIVGDRGGGGRTSLHRPPDKSSSRSGLTSLCTFRDGVSRQRRWSQA
jgi:hypothetical protein